MVSIGAKTVVRTVYGNSKCFEVKVGMHQGSALSPFVFVTVTEAYLKDSLCKLVVPHLTSNSFHGSCCMYNMPSLTEQSGQSHSMHLQNASILYLST